MAACLNPPCMAGPCTRPRGRGPRGATSGFRVLGNFMVLPVLHRLVIANLRATHAIDVHDHFDFSAAQDAFRADARADGNHPAPGGRQVAIRSALMVRADPD